jgi:hypothetical protein
VQSMATKKNIEDYYHYLDVISEHVNNKSAVKKGCGERGLYNSSLLSKT